MSDTNLPDQPTEHAVLRHLLTACQHYPEVVNNLPTISEGPNLSLSDLLVVRIKLRLAELDSDHA